RFGDRRGINGRPEQSGLTAPGVELCHKIQRRGIGLHDGCRPTAPGVQLLQGKEVGKGRVGTRRRRWACFGVQAYLAFRWWSRRSTCSNPSRVSTTSPSVTPPKPQSVKARKGRAKRWRRSTPNFSRK